MERNVSRFKKVQEARRGNVWILAASFLYGLRERKIERIEFKNVDISFADNGKAGEPAMLSGVGEWRKRGFFISNVDTLICDHVKISGQEGEALELSSINHYEVR